ncbi:ParB/RepB/Spo0J family partition protein [Legionella spiritensis]|uniref:Partition protein ParB n=1 Tax=Legionella spiritensis TaxID=452 RepID=A0A0W0YX69_LEGSP|nr:ParB/RepB/Spo0J family partition protein [Legionella spiritensis]KTD61230.1 partition protein ParB [Legionella spiritensis]SNV28060.1 partition protein ParB [Legionella spiritensis]
MQNFSLSDMLCERMQSVENELGFVERIIQLDCSEIDTWEFRDRKPFEIGNIDELALSIKHKGQCQPIVVVKTSDEFKPKSDAKAKYIVIAGFRRWSACKKHAIPIKAILRDLTFNQAVSVLVSENEKENVSDYSKGMFYNTLLQTEKINQEQLSEKLGISATTLSNFLAFSQVPEEIWTAVGDLSHVSAKSASIIRAIANKGTIYTQVLLEIADKIAKGYGEKRIKAAVEERLDKKLKRSLDTFNNHRFTHHGKQLMHLHRGQIKLSASLVQHERYEEVVAGIEKVLADFADFYFRK